MGMSEAGKRASKRWAGVAAVRYPWQRIVIPVGETGLEGGAEAREGLAAGWRGGGTWRGAEGASRGCSAP